MQPTTMLPKLTDTTQLITFSEGDGVCSAEVFATEVVVTTNAGNHNHGCSKVKLKNLVDYNWEPKFYPGQLLAVHMSGKYLAYSIKAPNSASPGTWNGMVRVVYNPEPGTDRRALIKGMKGEVQDLAFAHIQNQVVLACIDEHGTFYVHEIEATDSGLRCTLIAEEYVENGAVAAAAAASHRVVWCPYIPDDDDAPDDDVARLLLTTHANIARMWTVRGGGGGGGAGALGGGGAWGAEHGAALVDAAFSPDGTALATAAADGYVMFYQVYMDNESSPRCLHKWQPHAGAPLSCLFFLDNHKNYNTDVQFWKFAVTGAENNTIIKIWSCKSWNCLQTIRLTAPGAEVGGVGGLKAALDASAGYLLLSDFRARSLYVLRVARDAADATAYCNTISEFLLPYPVLSFCILDAEEEHVKCESSCDDPFHRNGSGGDAPDSPDDFDLQPDEEGPVENGGGNRRVRIRLYIVQPKGLQEGELLYCPPAHEHHPRSENGGGNRRVRIRLYIVQPKGLQEGELLYWPPAHEHHPRSGTYTVGAEAAAEEGAGAEAGGIASSILQQQSQQLKNLLMRSQTQPGSLIVPRAESPTIPPPPLNLMTPDAFSSPGKRDEDDPPLSATPDVAAGPRPATQGIAASETGSTVTSVGGSAVQAAAGAGVDVKLTSGGSSPSREVQEIMAHNERAYYKDDLEVEEAEEETDVAVLLADEAAAEEEVADEVFPRAEPYHAPDTAPAKLSNYILYIHYLALNKVTLETDVAVLLADEAAAEEEVADEVFPRVEPYHAPDNAPAKLNNDTSWPQISLAQISEANQRKASSDKSSSQSLNASLAQPDRLSPAERSRLLAIDHKLDKLTELVAAHSRELRSLRGAVQSPREVVDAALHAHTQRTAAAVHTALHDGFEKISRIGEAASSRAAQAAGLGAARGLEPLAAALHHELATKLTATDHLLRDNIEKLANSKMLMERLSTSIAKSLSEMVREQFRDALMESVVPVIEKAHAQMFRQINAAFQAGTKEFAVNTEAAARLAAERGGAAAGAQLRAALERHANALANAPPPAPAHYTAAIQEAARSVLEKEMSWWREQVALMSRAHSPATPHASHASHADRQMQVAQIQSLVAGGDVNGAFQLALSAADLALVVAACRAADPPAVFGPPCRLKQHVLLSLVQQLAADMARDTQLKHRYLEEAVMNLDSSNPVTREHLPVVVRELQKQVMSFLSAHPSHALARQFKMLLMAADSLVKAA